MLRGGVERTGAEGVGWLGFKRKEKGSSEMACWSSSYGGIAQFSRSQRPALKEQEAKKQGQFESGSSPGPVAEGAWGWEWGGAGEGILEKGMATHSSICVWRIPMDRGA